MRWIFQLLLITWAAALGGCAMLAAGLVGTVLFEQHCDAWGNCRSARHHTRDSTIVLTW